MADARGASGMPLHLPLSGSIPTCPAGPGGFESAIKTRRRQSLPSGQEGGRGAAAGPLAVPVHVGRLGVRGGQGGAGSTVSPAQREKPLARSECQKPGPTLASPRLRAQGAPSVLGAADLLTQAEAIPGFIRHQPPQEASRGPGRAAPAQLRVPILEDNTHSMVLPSTQGQGAPTPLPRFCPIPALPPLLHRLLPWGCRLGSADGPGLGAAWVGDLPHGPIKGFFQRWFYHSVGTD